MAMTVNGMKAAILAELNAGKPFTTPDDFAQAIAQAVVSYIQSNAVVTGTATGVSAGAATAPVVGTVA